MGSLSFGGGHRSAATVLAFGILSVGILASVAGGEAWHSYVRRQDAQAANAAVSGVSQALTSALRQDADFDGTAATLVSTMPRLSNRELRRWFSTLETNVHYPGVFGLAYIEVVPRQDLGGFAATVRSDPPFGLPLPGRFSVAPAGARPTYCLTRYGFAELPSSVTVSLLVRFAQYVSPTFDYCAQPIRPLLSVAEKTGKPVVASLATLFSEAPVGAARVSPPAMLTKSGLTAVLTPVFASGAGGDPGEHPRNVRGWVLSLFDAAQIVAPALSGQTHAAVTLEYLNPDGREAAIETGDAALHASTPERLRLPGTSWTAVLSAPALDNGIPASDQGLAVFALGFIVALLLFLLLQSLNRSRAAALDLVQKRTSELEYQALHDPLTGLPNRTLIFDRADQMLARAARDHLPVAALVIDLDGFKFVNDSFGHEVGDDLLRAVTRRLEVTTRSSDSVGRLGGDEFVILAEGTSVTAGADLIAERVLAVLSEPYDLDDSRTLALGASIGVATGIRPGAEQLMRDAEIALFEAKSRGHNRYVVFDPEVHGWLAGRGELEAELRAAVTRNEFRVLYQPILRLDDRAIVKVEALVRWNHPSRGMISPAEFIPVLEESGLISAVGRTVLEESCRQVSAWHKLGYTGVGVSVNVSARQLESDFLLESVEKALQASGLPPSLLTLEITESTIMRDIGATVRRLTKLKQLGVKLAVDDFGTGYSSLAYLQRFPVDELKIDRSFVSGAEESADEGALIRTLVQLGRLLRLETVAEGIETIGQLERLRRAGCECGQGYLFARPLDAAGIEAFLASTKVAISALRVEMATAEHHSGV